MACFCGHCKYMSFKWKLVQRDVWPTHLLDEYINKHLFKGFLVFIDYSSFDLLFVMSLTNLIDQQK